MSDLLGPVDISIADVLLVTQQMVGNPEGAGIDRGSGDGAGRDMERDSSE